MLLEAESERLYIGAREAVFALNASDISARSALAVSLFDSVLLLVVCLDCHVALKLLWCHLHFSMQELLRQHVILGWKYFRHS